MNTFVFSLVTWSGPIVGGLGLYFNLQWVFWLGTALAMLNLFINVASGAMRFPLLPLAAMILGSIVRTPWYVGVAFGLLAWTALEAASELPPFRQIFSRRAR